MAIDAKQVGGCLDECQEHLTMELLPFWLDRCRDDENGGFITHFDKDDARADADDLYVCLRSQSGLWRRQMCRIRQAWCGFRYRADVGR